MNKLSLNELQKIVRENRIPVPAKTTRAILLKSIIEYKKPVYTAAQLDGMTYRGLLKIKKDNKIASISRKRVDILTSITNWLDAPAFTFDTTPTPESVVESTDSNLFTVKDFVKAVCSKINKAPYPYYVRPTAVCDDKTVIAGKNQYQLVKDDDSKRKFITGLIDSVFTYDSINGMLTANIIRAEVDVFVPSIDTHKVFRVANSPDLNCLLKIIKNIEPARFEKLIKKFPNLESEKFIYHDQIDAIARYIRLRILTYTPLGAKTHTVWEEFGYVNTKILSVVVSNEHATVLTNLTTISGVKYVDSFTNLEDVNIIHIEWDYIMSNGEITGREIYYIIRLVNDELIIEKIFRPSSVIEMSGVDECVDFYRCYKPEQVLYKKFAPGNIKRIRDPHIADLVRQAEHFIGCKLIKPLPKIATEIDHNRNYSAYEKLEEYIGFPDTTLVPSKIPTTPSYVIINTIINPPSSFVNLYSYPSNSGKIVLPYPVFKFIQPNCDSIDIDFYLNSEFRHISLYDFINEYKPEYEKQFVNSAIGRSIAGGVKPTKPIDITLANETEMNQVIKECLTLEFDYQLTTPDTIRIEIPTKPNGDYCFHSYILGYASIHMMKKWEQYDVVGFNVDALIVAGKHFENDTQVGGWKSGKVKRHFSNLEVSQPIHKLPIIPDQIVVCNRPITFDRILVVGAAGVSKTFTEINDPVHGQIMATPRIELRDAIKQYFPNTFTGQKLFQPALDDSAFIFATARIPRNYQYLVLDEVGMYSRDEHEKILQRIPDGTILKYLYDPEQIHNAIAGTPVDIAFFVKRGFIVKYLNRTPTIRARHSYDYGTKLDGMRGLSSKNQLAYVKTNFASDNQVTNQDFIISGSHKRVKQLNDKYRHIFDTIRVRDRKRQYHYIQTDDPRIFWDKLSMQDKIPKKYKYLPAVAITPDSIQGRTITDHKLFVDYQYLHRPGCLYVALTRTTEESCTFLYDDEL